MTRLGPATKRAAFLVPTVLGTLGGSIFAVLVLAISVTYLIPATPCDSGCWTNNTVTRLIGLVGLLVTVVLVAVSPCCAVLIKRRHLRAAALLFSGVIVITVAWWSLGQHLVDLAARVRA